MIGSKKLLNILVVTALTFTPAISLAKDVKPKTVLLHNCSKNDGRKVMLACAIYFEARSEGKKGGKLVAHVVLNRLRDKHFPPSMRKVIYQPGQFTYTQRKDFRVFEKDAWEEANQTAGFLLYLDKNFPYVRNAIDLTKGSLYYKTKKTKAPWAKQMKLAYEFKDHQFYRRKEG